MKLTEIIAQLDRWAPSAYQESYDNARLICGNPNAEIEKALCTLDCTEQVVDEAIEKACQLVIAHHPIVFGGLKSLTGKNYVERTVIKAIKNDIAIYAIHTNLDSVWTGVNRKIGEQLGLSDLRILNPKKGLLQKLYTFAPKADVARVRQALFDAGAGHIGDYDHCSFNTDGTGTFRGAENTNPHVGEPGEEHHEPEERIEVIFPVHISDKVVRALISAHPYEEVAYDIVALENEHPRVGSGMIGTLAESMPEADFMKHVGERMKAPVIRHTPLRDRPVKTVAFCGGAGRFLLNNAMAQKADVFITGDFKYHDFFDADGRIVVMDIGHFESEQFTPELIKQFLAEKIPTFAVLLSEVKTNPVHYFIS